MNWLSIHIYPLEAQNAFLVRGLRPFLQQHIWAERGARAFFIRYADERGEHVRLRMRGDETALRKAFDTWQEGRGEWQEVPYQPEKERFGGEDMMPWAEEHFHLSSRVALERLARDMHTYGDAMFDALRMHSIATHAAGLTQAEAAQYFARLAQQWLPLFCRTDSPEAAAEIRSAFDQNLAPQKDDLRANLTALWKALDQEKFDKKQPEWARWALGNRMILPSFGPQLERALPSLLHLTNNRLGLSNPDEVYLCHILSKTLTV
jgi:thiopeptide-type bacteriocin biosynthesis protein